MSLPLVPRARGAARLVLHARRSARVGLLGLLCFGSLSAIKAHAEASPYLGRDNPLRSLLPSAAALSAHERGRHEQAIARALSQLAHVQHAEVLIAQREPSAAQLDLPSPAYHIQVDLALSAPGPSELEVERVVRGVLPELAPEHLRVVSHLPRPSQGLAPALTRVGPFMVAPESSATLRATLAACLAANALLAVLLLARRRRRGAR